MALSTAHRPVSPFVLFDPTARAHEPADHRAGSAPYDLVKTAGDRYRLTLAVPGFAADDLEIVTRNADLVVRGTPPGTADDVTVLHRGLVRRPFEHRFALAEHVRVDGARLADGLLTIDLVREVPEALKPRTIAIDNAA
ncbi:MAG: Hsp20 family protein [Alphaproteobacteria bacterium]|jgi:molecular chaperone IbpA|nr:Hsp20 family protein [Alphaproteobacteria bacterium]